MSFQSTLALDLGGTKLAAALVQDGAVIHRVQCPTPQPATPDAVISALVELARPLSRDVTHAGAASAGAVLPGGRVTATAQRTFPGWTEVPLAGRLERELGVPFALLNDARAAAWGEFSRGSGQGGSEFMFVTVSTGLGAGLILGGQLHLARNGLDAEMGFVSVPAAWAGERYAVPALGELTPLEYEGAGGSLSRHAPTLGFVDARELADAAQAGHPEAEALMARSAALVAWKMADVAALLGVTRVAVGGSVGLRPDYLPRVRAALDHFPATYRPEVVPAALGADAGLIGIAEYAQLRR